MTSVRSGGGVIRFARTALAHLPARVTQGTHYRAMEKRAKRVQVRYLELGMGDSIYQKHAIANNLLNNDTVM